MLHSSGIYDIDADIYHCVSTLCKSFDDSFALTLCYGRLFRDELKWEFECERESGKRDIAVQSKQIMYLTTRHRLTFYDCHDLVDGLHIMMGSI